MSSAATIASSSSELPGACNKGLAAAEVTMKHSSSKSSNASNVPYQALPVCPSVVAGQGSLISHHRASALQVLEPGVMPEEVRAAAGHCAGLAWRAAPPANFRRGG